MKRNDDWYWYNKGYSDGTQDKKKEAKPRIVIGVVCALSIAWFNIPWIWMFVGFWALFEIQEWWDLRKWHESDPPNRWNE